MATNDPILIPSPIPNKANPGEKKVYRLLRQQLPPGYIAWYELTLSFRRESRYPDFIIIGPDQGIIVLEVKDWVLDNISQVKRTLFVLRAGQRELKEHDPFKQARENILLVKDILEASKNPRLVHESGPHQGKLRFPYRHAVILTNLTRTAIAKVSGLQRLLANEPVLLKDDLDANFMKRLLAIMPVKFKAPMSTADIDAARWVLYPEIRIENRKDEVLDLVQDGIIKNHLSEEAERALGDPLTRLVHGPAGSGKSLVLIKRAVLESVSNPNWRTLVLTYNRRLAYYLECLVGDDKQTAAMPSNLEITNFHRWCRKVLETIGYWRSPIENEQRGALIREAIERAGVKLNIPGEFFAEEIGWMKENVLTSWESYRTADRGGRGIGLAETTRAKVFKVFDTYRELLGDEIDWDDVPLRVLYAMKKHLVAAGCYEAVFVDEAQDFAPSWFYVVRSLVNPKTSVLFLAADSTQRIYQRGFSWKKLGLNVKGRTLVLRERYRNPPAIQLLAYDLIKNDEELKWQMEDAGEELVEPGIEVSGSVDFSPIIFKEFRNVQAEYGYLVSEIRKLLGKDYRLADIAVFHRYKWGVKEIEQYLRKDQVSATMITGENVGLGENEINVCTLHSSKGLEFPVVFICGLDRINYGLKFAPQNKEMRELWLSDWVTEEKKLLYVGMTRSTNQLYLTCHGTLPGFVAELVTVLTRLTVGLWRPCPSREQARAGRQSSLLVADGL